MKIIGLTGGMGSGKSTVAEFLPHRGIPFIDTDQLAHDLVHPGSRALVEIREAFGPGVLAADGSLLRSALAEVVFSDSSARVKLESILHPRIQAAWMAEVSLWRSRGLPMGVVVIPLLFEKGLELHFDITICVACSAATQLRRLLSRGWAESQIRLRLSAQLPMATKMQRADRVLWNDGSLAVLARQMDRVFAESGLPCPGMGGEGESGDSGVSQG